MRYLKSTILFYVQYVNSGSTVNATRGEVSLDSKRPESTAMPIPQLEDITVSCGSNQTKNPIRHRKMPPKPPRLSQPVIGAQGVCEMASEWSCPPRLFTETTTVIIGRRERGEKHSKHTSSSLSFGVADFLRRPDMALSPLFPP